MKAVKLLRKPAEMWQKWRAQKAETRALAERFEKAAQRGDWEFEEIVSDPQKRFRLYVDPPLFHPVIMETMRAEIWRRAEAATEPWGPMQRASNRLNWRLWLRAKETLVSPIFNPEIRPESFYEWRFNFREQRRKEKFEKIMAALDARMDPAVTPSVQVSESDLAATLFWREEVAPCVGEEEPFKSNLPNFASLSMLERQIRAYLAHLIEVRPPPFSGSDFFSTVEAAHLPALRGHFVAAWNDYSLCRREAYARSHAKIGLGYEPTLYDSEDIICPELQARMEAELNPRDLTAWTRIDFTSHLQHVDDKTDPHMRALSKYRVFGLLIGLKVLSTLAKGAFFGFVLFVQLLKGSGDPETQRKKAAQRLQDEIELTNREVRWNILNRDFLSPAQMLEYTPGQFTPARQFVVGLQLDRDPLSFLY